MLSTLKPFQETDAPVSQIRGLSLRVRGHLPRSRSRQGAAPIQTQAGLAGEPAFCPGHHAASPAPRLILQRRAVLEARQAPEWMSLVHAHLITNRHHSLSNCRENPAILGGKTHLKGRKDTCLQGLMG